MPSVGGELVVTIFFAELAEDARANAAVDVFHIAKVERADRRPDHHQADEHAEVADTVDDESLVGGGAGALAFDVEADEEVRADADELPEDERHRQVARDADAEHREREQRQELEEAVKAAAAVEVFVIREVDFVVDVVLSSSLM